LAAIHGSQQAHDALAEFIPFYSLKQMNDASNALAEQGKSFEVGKKSSECMTASISTAVVAGQAVKASVGLFRVAKMTAKLKRQASRVPASFGRSQSLNPSHITLTAEIPSAFPQYFSPDAPRPIPRIHHAIAQTVIEGKAAR
jgi:hypothetical protein